MDSSISIEELVFTKMQTTLTNRFNMDTSSAAELALELVEVLNTNELNLLDFDQLYLN